MGQKITTVLTSHNRPDILPRAIQSVVGQTHDDWQLVIADDTKHGITRERIKKIGEDAAKSDKRIIFMQNEPTDITKASGYAVQINKALKITDGNYITYLCDDDMYDKDHYKTCLETFFKFPQADIIYSGMLIIRQDGGQALRSAALIKKCGFFTVDHMTVMHKKEVLAVVGDWSESVHHIRFGDAELWMRMSKAGYLMYPTQDVTCIKEIQPDSLNITGGAKSEQFNESIPFNK